MLHNREKRVCPYSKTEFIPKRNNQIFATKEYRIAFHNNINGSVRRKLSIVNNQLIKNYKVFDSLLGNDNEVIANKHYLRGAGFSFKNFTHVANNNNSIVYGVYDILFEKLNEEEYLIYRTKKC